MIIYNKLEIIISDIHLDLLIERLEVLGITGYTVLPIEKSKGPEQRGTTAGWLVTYYAQFLIVYHHYGRDYEDDN